MEMTRERLYKSRFISLLLASSLLLTSCGEESTCQYPVSHVHKYVKTLDNGISIVKYLDDEDLVKWNGYKWCEDFLDITKIDESAFKALDGAFDGATNWDFLYYQMASHRDYLKFYYYYTTTERVRKTDSNGDVYYDYETRVHDGWTTNPNRSYNTGKVRVYHHYYYGYKLVYENGRFKLIKSPYVDDFREIIGDYPYFKEDCVYEDYETFHRNRYELSNLTPDDFDTSFGKPDLVNKELYYSFPLYDGNTVVCIVGNMAYLFEYNACTLNEFDVRGNYTILLSSGEELIVPIANTYFFSSQEVAKKFAKEKIGNEENIIYINNYKDNDVKKRGLTP